MTTAIRIPEIHWCRQHSMWCINASIWNECRLTACNKKWLKEMKQKENKMTNREWLEGLSDEKLAELLTENICDSYCAYADDCTNENACECVTGVTEWLQQEHKKPKKDQDG